MSIVLLYLACGAAWITMSWSRRRVTDPSWAWQWRFVPIGVVLWPLGMTLVAFLWIRRGLRWLGHMRTS